MIISNVPNKNHNTLLADCAKTIATVRSTLGIPTTVSLESTIAGLMACLIIGKMIVLTKYQFIALMIYSRIVWVIATRDAYAINLFGEQKNLICSLDYTIFKQSFIYNI